MQTTAAVQFQSAVLTPIGMVVFVDKETWEKEWALAERHSPTQLHKYIFHDSEGFLEVLMHEMGDRYFTAPTVHQQRLCQLFPATS